MRPLSDAFENLLYKGWRQPAYKLLAFDPAQDSLSAVVTGTQTQTPFDLTPYCTSLSWSPAQLTFTLADPQKIFHPDKGASRQYLADSAIIRLVEGDVRLPQSEWINSFTGCIKGQIGWQNNRSQQILQAKVTVFSRDNAQGLKRRLVTTPSYTVGTDVGKPFYDLAMSYIGMSAREIRVPAVLGLQLRSQITQFCQMAPWDALTKILEAVGQVPFFDGDGRLACWNKNMHRAPDRILTNGKYILDDQIPANTQDNINYIRVNFLDSQLTQVTGPYQKIGSAQITTGFFTMQEKLNCFWSKDGTQRAYGTEMKVMKSVNSGLLPVGTESYEQIDDFHGVITVDIGPWVPGLIGIDLAAYVYGQMHHQDEVVVPLGSTGWTIPLGRLLSATELMAIMIIMASLGSAQYEIWGYPYDFVYLKQHSEAIESTLDAQGNPQAIPYYQQNQRQIDNDLIGSFDQADTIALTELTWEKSKCYPRNLVMEDDPALEIGDIVQLADGRKFLIQDMNKNIQRGEVPTLQINAIKVMTP